MARAQHPCCFGWHFFFVPCVPGSSPGGCILANFLAKALCCSLLVSPSSNLSFTSP
ncbi:uncharacterized protein DS421_9g268520 [Arachis hypogaea]|nr:uncharacterized protein DS421_9g268520 [Arachis hypogaea]